MLQTASTSAATTTTTTTNNNSSFIITCSLLRVFCCFVSFLLSLSQHFETNSYSTHSFPLCSSVCVPSVLHHLSISSHQHHFLFLSQQLSIRSLYSLTRFAIAGHYPIEAMFGSQNTYGGYNNSYGNAPYYPPASNPDSFWGNRQQQQQQQQSQNRVNYRNHDDAIANDSLYGYQNNNSYPEQSVDGSIESGLSGNLLAYACLRITNCLVLFGL